MKRTVRGVGEVVRNTVRSLARSPGFALGVVGTLALGIGANATLFEVVDRLLLSPPHAVDEPDEIRRLWARETGADGAVSWSGPSSHPGFETLRRSGAFEAVAAHAALRYDGAGGWTLGSGPDASRVQAQMVSGSYFDALGAEAHLGRLITPDDDRLDAIPVVVLSHRLWSREFGSDPHVLGTTVHLDELRYRIVGVAPPGFTGATLHPIDAWVPLLPAGTASFGEGWHTSENYLVLDVFARLGDEVSEDVAMQRAEAAYQAFRRASDPEVGTLELVGRPLAGLLNLSGDGRLQVRAEARVARWLAGVALMVLLVACANVANLFLARATRRRREVAVRVALGIDRRRLFGHHFAEAAILALLAAGAALFVSRGAGWVVQTTLLPEIAWSHAVSPGALLGFTGLLVLVTAALTGIGPAIVAMRTDTSALSDRSRSVSGGSGRIGSLLIVAQTALSAVLVVGAGLFVLSFWNAKGVDLGFDPERVVTVEIERSEVAETSTTELYREAMEQVARIPGVRHVSSYATLPFSVTFGLPVHVSGMDTVPRLPSGRVSLNAVGADYFRVMGTSIVSGRPFDRADIGNDDLVAIVNETFADHVWRGNALGRCIQVGGPGAECARVVGIAGDQHTRALVEDRRLMVWLPSQTGPLRGIAGLVVRTGPEPGTVVPLVRREIQALGGGVRFVETGLLADRIAPEYRSWRLGATVFSALGILAVIVAAVGLYSTLMFDVDRSKRETGIRMALGAPRSHVLRRVVGRAVGLAASGCVVGVGLAWLFGSSIEPLLFGVSLRDPVVTAGAGLLLVGLAVAAALPPALRAASVDPARTIRTE